MTLDEAIKHCQEVACSCNNEGCSLEHSQLASWLVELKYLREKCSFNGEKEFKNLPETTHKNPWIEKLIKPQYICCYCGRKMVYPVAHKCNTGFRKRHLKWKKYEEPINKN